MSTIGFIVGSAALAGGAMLFFTASKPAAAARLRYGVFGGAIEGSF